MGTNVSKQNEYDVSHGDVGEEDRNRTFSVSQEHYINLPQAITEVP